MLFEPKEKGQGLVDYSLIILLIALIVIAAVALFGTNLANIYSRIAHADAWPQ